MLCGKGCEVITGIAVELKMKKPWIAFLLNFLVAGAGFAYLGKWAWAGINFGAAIAVGIVLYYLSPDSVSTASIVVAATSGSLAMSTAKSMNAKLSPQPAPLPHS
jgi:uncharacterized membrane protein YjjP (DUF1212 family)